jgi:hypothetical protein
MDKAHPLLHYVVNKLVGDLFGMTLLVQRMVALCMGMGVFVVLGDLARVRPYDRAVIFCGMGLLAMNRQFLTHMQEGRGYMQYLLLVALLWRWMQDERPRWWALFGTAAALANTHYVGVGFGLALCLARRERAFVVPVMAGLATLLPWLAWVAPLYAEVGTLNDHMEWLAIPGWTEVSRVVTRWFAGFLTYAGFAPFIGLYGFLLVWAWRRGEALARQAALVASIVPLLCFLATRWPLELRLFENRYFLPSLLGIVMLPFVGVVAKGRVALLVLLLSLQTPWRHVDGSIGSRLRRDELAHDYRAGKWGQLPLYAYPYLNIGMSLDYHCGQPCARELSDALDAMPNRFLLAYGLRHDGQLPRVRRLEARGYRMRDLQKYGPELTLALMEKSR